MSPYSVLPPGREAGADVGLMARVTSRRRFLRQFLGGAVLLSGLDCLAAQENASTAPQAFRFAFLTDLHLLENGKLGSADGIAACLDAVEKLDPRPEFILTGGDLVHDSRHLPVDEAERRLDFFLQIWKNHTSLPAHWVFGNHDLVGTSNPAVPANNPHYSKGLFRDRFQLPQLFYSFDFRGWHFVILDDIAPEPGGTYQGELFNDELAFLRTDLAAHAAMPTILCAHIPMVSALPMSVFIAMAKNLAAQSPSRLVCVNADELMDDFPGHNVKAVLSGHLHHYERMEINGVRFINSGAVCGNYWKGKMLDCPEGFGVVDLGADGSVKFAYRDYGWTARA